MPNPFKRRKPDYTYEMERERLLNWLNDNEPHTPEYKEVMNRLNELDRMHKRASEVKKTVIPALGGIGAVVGIYGLQQFAGVLIPKALEIHATRQEQKSSKKED